MTVAARVEPGELFLPELTVGTHALLRRDREHIEQYLFAVIEQRRLALAVPSLWNALYFGWDLEARGYVAVPSAFEEALARIVMGGRHDALPVGALLRVTWGEHAFWAEVLHKTGARPQADAGWLASELSCARATEEDGRVVLRERLVIDPAVFGPELAPSAVQLERARRHGRWLDARGHLEIDADYPDIRAADLDDTAFFARWMWDNHRPVLAGGRLRACLEPQAGEDDLQDAFLASLAVVEEIASGIAGLGRWRAHYFALSDYHGVLDSPEHPFNRQGLEWLARSLAHPPRGTGIAYAALGPRLAELERHGELTGSGYSLAVCHAGAFILERLAEVAPEGRDADGVHLRLDDPWQQGGIWRAEVMESRGALCDLAPELALGLGWAESRGLLELDGESEPLIDEEEGEHEPEILLLEDQMTVFRVTLGTRHLEQGLLRLPPEIAAGLELALEEAGSPRQVVLTLELPGEQLERALASQAVGMAVLERALCDIEWPLAAHPGLHLLVSWSIGTSSLSARASLRDTPLELGGYLYLWECDEQALARALGLAEMPRRPSSLRALILETLRRRGRVGPDSSRAAVPGPLASAIFGPSPPAGARAAVRLELELMEREGLLGRRGEEFVWTPRTQRPRQAPDLGALRDYLATTATRREGLTRRHTVVLFLRRLPPGHRASIEKERSYADEVAREGLVHHLPAQLPAGFTYVSTHERGTHPGASGIPPIANTVPLGPAGPGHRIQGDG